LTDPVRRVGAVLKASGCHPGRTALDHLRVLVTASRLPKDAPMRVLAESGLAVDAFAPAAAHRRHQSRPAGSGALPTDGVHIWPGSEQRPEERHLQGWQGTSVDFAGSRVEDPGLRRTRRASFLRIQCQQPQQAGILGLKLLHLEIGGACSFSHHGGKSQVIGDVPGFFQEDPVLNESRIDISVTRVAS
jgi:hypothetical protein